MPLVALATADATIRAALRAHTLALVDAGLLPGTRAHQGWEGGPAPFKAPADGGLYFREALLRGGNPVRRSLGGAGIPYRATRTGLYQLTLVVPRTQGLPAAEALAGRVAAHFRGADLTRDGLTITCSDAGAGTTREEPAALVVPVTVSWTCDTLES